MVDPSLEQQVLLALGWQRAARGRAGDKTDLSIPPEAHDEPGRWLRGHQARARETLVQLEAQLHTLREATADKAQRAFRKRARLVERMGASRRSAREINAAAAPLTREFEACLEDARSCDRLLDMVRGDVQTPVPDLPLHRYEEALERLRGREASQGGVVDSGASASAGGAAAPSASMPARVAAFIYRRTDRSDRLALAVALPLAMAVVALGVYYMYSWGSITLEVDAAGEHRYQVACVNATAQPIMLYVPYDGKGLPRAELLHVGIALDLLDEAGAPIPVPHETAWTYKEQPAHLYGPIVVSPMSSAELQLDLAPYFTADRPHTVQWTLYKAPHRRHAVRRMPVPASDSEEAPGPVGYGAPASNLITAAANGILWAQVKRTSLIPPSEENPIHGEY